MNHNSLNQHLDRKPDFYITNIATQAVYNCNYRSELWTGCYLQTTLMSIPVCSDIGLEIHKSNDQIIRIEEGKGLLQMGYTRSNLCYQQNVTTGDMIFVPAGIWHNVSNIGGTPLKLSVIYGPPHHPAGTIHKTKSDAERTEH